MIDTRIAYQICKVVNAPTWGRFLLVGFVGRVDRSKAQRVFIDDQEAHFSSYKHALDGLAAIWTEHDGIIEEVGEMRLR